MAKELSPFDFVKAVSHTKNDLIKESEYPEHTEKLYNPFIVNKNLSFFEDTVLHANEMNRRHSLFNDAQFRYYLGALRKRSRFSKWFKAEKSADLDLIQEVYGVNRSVAKMYLKTLSTEDISKLSEKINKGG